MGECIIPRRGVPIFEPAVDNTTYLYYLGDEYEEITGGYTHAMALEGSSRTGSLTKNSDNMEIYGKYAGSIANAGIALDMSGASLVACVASAVFYNNTTSSNRMVAWMNENGTKYQYYFMQTPGSRGTHTYSKAVYIGTNREVVSNDWSGIEAVAWQSFSDTVTAHIYAFVVAKQDDITPLSAYGSTIAQIIANASSLLSDSSAVNKMIKCNGDFMWSALADSGFITALNASPNKNTVLANPQWAKAVALIL